MNLDALEEALQEALAYVSIYCSIQRLGMSNAFPPFDPAARVLRVVDKSSREMLELRGWKK